MDERDHKAMNEELNQPSCLGAVISRFIYLITNETDGIVESAWSNFEEAKKECQQWEKMKPQKRFMVVELPINGL
jgi:hypothetical protein